jgi:mono/diheme cytochrome c family protein
MTTLIFCGGSFVQNEDQFSEGSIKLLTLLNILRDVVFMSFKKSGLFFLGVLSLGAHAQDSMPQFLASQQLVESGRVIFQQNCSGCHGVDAKGEGPAALMLDPKPRNLVSGAYKFRSTSLGSLPTTEDLIRTIEQGVPGSSMPGFPLMSTQEKYALVAFIKSLRSDWKKNEGRALLIPEAPAETFRNRTLFLASAFKGQKLYLEACISCHGDDGRGDGPSAADLVDSDNNPLPPADLGRHFIKSGRRVQDIYKAIYTGLDGTPMPAFEGVYDEGAIWNIVAYVMFLRGRESKIYAATLQLNEEHAVAAAEFGRRKAAATTAPSTSSDSWD